MKKKSIFIWITCHPSIDLLHKAAFNTAFLTKFNNINNLFVSFIFKCI